MRGSTAMVWVLGSFFVALRFAAAADPKAVEFDAAMQPILAEYLKIQTGLAGDRTDGVARAAASIAALAKKLDAAKVGGDAAASYKDLPAKIAKAAEAMAKESAIAALREKLKDLSKPMALWGTLAKPAGVSVVYCSMAPGSWLQPEGPIKNPYYGAAMLACGEVVGGAGAAAGH
ncbi:MAG: DUF3347 domain-containing protein [Deltaproteobacteria bacterium]|nr:DUF3347 domain-containing protein [Deltaproteobacteria bacterium]